MPLQRPVMTSVASLTDRTAPWTENKRLSRSAVISGERLRTTIFVVKCALFNVPTLRESTLGCDYPVFDSSG